MFATFYRKGRAGQLEPHAAPLLRPEAPAATAAPQENASPAPDAVAPTSESRHRARGRLAGRVRATTSRYNVVYPVDAAHSLLFNTVSGAVDLVPRELGDKVMDAKTLAVDAETYGFLANRGYIWESEHDEQAVVSKLGQAIREQARRESPLKLLLIPTYRCNLSCTYCWQQPHVKQYWKDTFSPDMADAAFAAMLRLEETKGKDTAFTELQLFGGEPLLPAVRPLVERTIRFGEERRWRVRITTNGMGLVDYLGFLREHPPAEIQITVDGPPDMLRMRRRGADFEKIAAGIEGLLFAADTVVNMRVNLDGTNLETLPELANILIDRKWFTNPNFSTYIAPTRDENFEKRDMYDVRVPLLHRFLELREQYPQLEIFHIQGWTGFKEAERLAQTGRMLRPMFQSCDANMNMYVFDSRGLIYACNEGNGDESRSVGRFYPDYFIDDERLGSWRLPVFMQRETCRQCSLAPLCGGGCAISETHSAYHEGYCRDVKATFRYAMTEYAKTVVATCESR